MIAIYFKQFVDSPLLQGLSERARRRIIKNTALETMRFWHNKILPKHFTLAGQQGYPSGTFEYTKSKKANSKPSLVDAGNFRDRILKTPEIRATYRAANIKYRFGRPSESFVHGNLDEYRATENADYKLMDPRVMKPSTRNNIFHFMKGKSINFEEARKQVLDKKQRMVFKWTAYSSKLKVRMARGVSVFNDKDRQAVRAFAEAYIKDNFQRLSKANIRKLKPLRDAA